MINSVQKNKLSIALAIGLLVTIITSSFTVFAKECDNIRENVLRFHIIANSNTKEDQELKLKVRDRILELDKTLFENSSNFVDAKAVVEKNLDKIKQTAQDEIYKNGYSYEVKAQVCKMYFNTREYDTFTMPAGKYNAVRLTIGEAKGKNWWCVLYPPLCLPAASSKKELKDILSQQQINILEGKQKYEIKFATVEIYEKLMKLLFD